MPLSRFLPWPVSILLRPRQHDECEPEAGAATRGQPPDDCVVSALHHELAVKGEECSKTLHELDILRHEYAEVKKSLVKARKNEDVLSRTLTAEQRQNHEARERLLKLQNDVERATVLLKKEKQDKVDVMQDRDRYRDQINRRLLSQGTDIQAAFPTTFEIRARIERVAIEAASDWLEGEEEATHQWYPGISPRRVLAGLFFQCQALVQQQHQEYNDFFLGGPAATEAGEATAMGQDTADFMRGHMRRHFTTLFPLTGVDLERACRQVDAKLRRWVAQTQAVPAVRPQAEGPPPPKMANVIQEYLHVLVTAKLQNPPMRFSEDCGMEQPFDSKVHSQPIDGDSIGSGDSCIVVFPCLMHEVEDRNGSTPLTKKFILPVVVDVS